MKGRVTVRVSARAISARARYRLHGVVPGGEVAQQVGVPGGGRVVFEVGLPLLSAWGQATLVACVSRDGRIVYMYIYIYIYICVYVYYMDT